MMNYPPIDSMEKIMENKYELCCVMANRAKELEKLIPAEIETSDVKSISMAADEIYKGKIVASNRRK